jgi:hypothetical protein
VKAWAGSGGQLREEATKSGLGRCHESGSECLNVRPAHLIYYTPSCHPFLAFPGLGMQNAIVTTGTSR